MSKTFSKNSKLKLYKSVIRPTVIYASETWYLRKNERKVTNILKENHRRIYGQTVDPNSLSSRTNEEINILLKQRNIVRYIKAQRPAWLGHLERMHEDRTTKKITRWKPLSSRLKG
jgi:hypothetical protein